jgi:hypothetical protein
VVEVREMRRGVRRPQAVFACRPRFCRGAELTADDVELVSEPVHGVVQFPVADDVRVDPPICVVVVRGLSELVVLSSVAVEESSEPSRHGFGSLGAIHRSRVEFNGVWIGGRVVLCEVSRGAAVMEDTYPPDGLDDPVVHWDGELWEAAVVGHVAVWRTEVLPGIAVDAVVEEVAFLLEVGQVNGMPVFSCLDGAGQSVDDSAECGGVQVWVAGQGVESTSG